LLLSVLGSKVVRLFHKSLGIYYSYISAAHCFKQELIIDDLKPTPKAEAFTKKKAGSDPTYVPAPCNLFYSSRLYACLHNNRTVCWIEERIDGRDEHEAFFIFIFRVGKKAHHSRVKMETKHIMLLITAATRTTVNAID
jgi:hypothetical protein